MSFRRSKSGYKLRVLKSRGDPSIRRGRRELLTLAGPNKGFFHRPLFAIIVFACKKNKGFTQANIPAQRKRADDILLIKPISPPKKSKRRAKMPKTKLEQLIDQQEFISPRDLVSCGLFRTRSSVRNAVENGAITEVRISERVSAIKTESLRRLFGHNELDF